MLTGKAMERKLTNLSEIINNDVSCENKDHRKPYNSIFCCCRKSHIGRHLRWHCQPPSPVSIAAFECMMLQLGI